MINKTALLVFLVTIGFNSFAQKTFFNRVGEASNEANSYYYRVANGGQNYNSFYSSNDAKFFAGKIINANNQSEKDNLYSGKCIWYYKNGNVKKEVHYDSEGKQEGKTVEYFENGKISLEVTYKDGKPKNGKYTSYDEKGNASQVFKDDFDNNLNDWDLYSSVNGGATLVDGKMVLVSESKLGLARYISFYSEASTYSIDLIVNIEKLGGGKGGLIYGFKDWNNYNFYLISRNSVFIGSVYEGITTYEMEGMYSYDIASEGSNNLKLLTKNGQTVFSINGSVQYAGKESTRKGSNIGVVVSGKNSIAAETLIFKELNSSSQNSALMENDDNFTASGSGFIIDKTGYILTNYHVIENAQQIVVEMNVKGEIKKYDAELVQVDKDNDLAVIKLVDFSNLQIKYAFKPAGSESMGSEIFTLGYPLALNGMGKSVKFVDGKISSKTGYQGAVNSYQTSIPVQPGNSGGPVFNQNGEVIGIVNAKISGADNVSYAIKINYAKNLIDLLPGGISYPSNSSSLSNLSLERKIKVLQDYVVLIKIK